MRLCFVCLGNICRSPTAEGIMRSLIAEAGLAGRVHVDSAGTGAWHIGEPPDGRARATARRRGLVLDHEAWQFGRGDFARFDLVLAMDRANLRALRALAPPAARDRLHLLRWFDPAADDLDVPDPYYGGPGGFDHVFDVCTAACTGLLDHVRGLLEAR